MAVVKVKNKALRLLLWLTLVKGVAMSVIVPLWEFPDEQVHFSQVMHYVEVGFDLRGDNLAEENLVAQEIMGTVRDEWGINNYTYHPEYRPEYSLGLDGSREKELKTLPNSTRSKLVKIEAARYPAVFYLLSDVGYLLAYPFNLLIRVFATRMVSVVLTVVSVWVMYRVGKELFENEVSAVVLAGMLGFHPMFSFVGAGVNNDNLLNLIGLMILYELVLVVKNGLEQKNALVLGGLCGLGLLVKQLIIPLAASVGLALMFEWWLSKRSLKAEFGKLHLMIGVGLFAGGWLYGYLWWQSGQLPYMPTFREGTPDLSLGQYLIQQGGKYYRETLVWYWGVFKWLGVILPLNVIRLIKVVMLAAGVGIVKYGLGKKKLVPIKQVGLMFLLASGFVAVLTGWDYLVVSNRGVSHGLQGRYFFPVIGAHLVLLYTGLVSLMPKKRFRIVNVVILLWMVGLNLVSMKVLMENYYDTRNLWTLLMQMSQYKPWFLKYPFSLLWLGGYGLLLVNFVLETIRLKGKRAVE